MPQRFLNVFKVLIALTLCAGTLSARENTNTAPVEYSDPRSPAAHAVSPQATVPHARFYQIQSRLKEIEQGIADEEAKLAALPPLKHSLQVDAYGYHSDYLPVEAPKTSEPSEPRWVLTFDMAWGNGPLDLVLVPTIDPRISEPTSYGFPRRFRITSANEKPRVFVDWTEADFPDPGLRPVYFHLPEFRTRKVRLEVFEGPVRNNLEFFSLARVYMIRQNEVQKLDSIETSSSQESSPYWSSHYLADQRFTLGLPLGAQRTENNDFILPIEQKPDAAPLVLEFDLQQNNRIGWVSFFPAQNPDNIALPGYGFPGSIKIDVIRESPNGRRVQPHSIVPQIQSGNPGSNLVRFPGNDLIGRYLRIELDDFPTYTGQQIFAMGEIVINKEGEHYNLDIPPTISIDGLPVDVDSSALSDGIANGHEQIDLVVWLRTLASAKPIENTLEHLQRERAKLNLRWQPILRASGVLAALLVSLIILSIISYLLISRKRANVELRRQISTDLHDDIGSKVAAIGLASTFIEKQSQQEVVRESGTRIRDISKKMNQSLRDVLWLTDTQTDTIEQLFYKLVEIAKQTVSSKRLSINYGKDSDFPNRSIKVQIKRDLLQFLREALHNATVHSEAQNIQIEILWRKKTLELRIEDDGIGFEMPDEETIRTCTDHHGLNNLSIRAKRLKATYQIKSTPNQGTSLSLHVAL